MNEIEIILSFLTENKTCECCGMFLENTVLEDLLQDA